MPPMAGEPPHASHALREESPREGIVVDRELQSLLGSAIRGPADAPVQPTQVQPASLDLRLGPVAHRIRAGFLPERAPVEDRLRELATSTVSLEGEGAVLERGLVYLVPLEEELDLPPALQGRFNPRSSSGRCDLFTRVLVSGHPRFDETPAGLRRPAVARGGAAVVPDPPEAAATGSPSCGCSAAWRPSREAELRDVYRAHAALLRRRAGPDPAGRRCASTRKARSSCAWASRAATRAAGARRSTPTCSTFAAEGAHDVRGLLGARARPRRFLHPRARALLHLRQPRAHPDPAAPRRRDAPDRRRHRRAAQQLRRLLRFSGFGWKRERPELRSAARRRSSRSAPTTCPSWSRTARSSSA